MADSIESSVLQAIINGLSSPIVKKIGEVFDVGDELRQLLNSWRAQSQAQDQAHEDFNGGLRIQRRVFAYEDEDLLHNLTIFAANFLLESSGEEGLEKARA